MNVRSLWLFVGALACQDAKQDSEEGPNESDPGTDTVDDDVTDPDTPDWSNIAAPPTTVEVCFPGPDLDGTVCLPTVEWSADWGADYEYPPPLDDNPQYSAPARYVDLYADSADPDLALAPNFALDEVMQASKGRFALFQPHTIESLQVLRDWIGGPLYINSAYRNVEYNAGVGGATWSRHQYGDAVDIRSNDASLEELADYCDALGAGYTSIYETHVHCDWRDTPLETAFYDPETTEPDSPAARVLVAEDGAVLTLEAEGFDEGQPAVRWTGRNEAGAVVESHRGPEYRPSTVIRRVDVQVAGRLSFVVGL